MRINRAVVDLLVGAGLLVILGLAIFPTRAPDEIAALVGIPLTIYLVLPLFLSHLLGPDKPKKERPTLRQIFANAPPLARVLLFLILSGVTAAYAGIVMSLSALAHALVGSQWGQQISTLLAFWFLAVGGGAIALIVGGLYLLQMALKGIRIYRGWLLARKAVQRSAEWVVSSASRYARAA